ncbi:hypothetical protein BDY17DRAFT_125340 [Neohortaea acidophila]|uniref:Uncharacterized protein n=1 Tax=Neohortaea acidophila TaxID=245834 RepID=A0A6A6PYJ9_9PEZI|nr:uncharacterized protein BDY17DRAFT_125340 [Neohortaea acidophila]KAF2484297.1 hypothetical protein BDY17DRAFT_125340 [Neohortaea acidophila]
MCHNGSAKCRSPDRCSGREGGDLVFNCFHTSATADHQVRLHRCGANPAVVLIGSTRPSLGAHSHPRDKSWPTTVAPAAVWAGGGCRAASMPWPRIHWRAEVTGTSTGIWGSAKEMR